MSVAVETRSKFQIEGVELLKAAQAGDETAFNDFIKMNTNMVHMLVRKYNHPRITQEDKISFCFEALYLAAKSFDFSKEHEFSTYAISCMHNILRKALRDCDRKKYGTLNQTTSIDMELSDSEGATNSLHELYGAPDTTMFSWECNEALKMAMEEASKEVAAFDWWYEVNVKGKTSAELASELGFTRQHVSNQVRKAKQQISSIVFRDLTTEDFAALSKGYSL